MNGYFDWLLSKIGGGNTYSKVLKQLYNEEFTWSQNMQADSNRAADGLLLRENYTRETGIKMSTHFMSRNCSVLEMMIALSERVDREITGIPGESHPEILFWQMMNNARLSVPDRAFNVNYVVNIVDNILMRNFDQNGFGGFFPLNYPVTDQRTTPIWNQMMGYLKETLF